MYSVAPLVVRKARQDVRIGHYTIPKGTAMILHLFAMHNTSANFERHTEFLPVRLMELRHPCLTEQHSSSTFKAIISLLIAARLRCSRDIFNSFVLRHLLR